MIRQILPFSVLALAACQGPWGGIEKLSDQTLASDTASVEVVAGTEGADRMTSAEDLAAMAAIRQVSGEKPKGFLTLLKSLVDVKSDEADAPPVVLAGMVQEDGPDILRPRSRDDVGVTGAEPQTVTDAAPMPGLFGLLGGRRIAAAPEIPQPTPNRRAVEKDVVPGTVMAFGNVGRICNLRNFDMGEVVARYPERRAKYKIHDLAADSLRSRTIYITGFDDGCARQVTGAMAMFGDVEMHEALRYGTAGNIQPTTDVGAAYNRVKSRVCKVGKNKPCGDKISELQEDTVFLSVYETFGNGGRWNTLLLHNGQVEAAAIGAPQE